PRTIRATIKSVVCLDAVPYYPAAAVIANGREFMNRALETIERVTRPSRHNLERKVIIVAAHFTLSHPGFPPQISQITQIHLCNLWITYDFLLRAELID